MSFLIFPSEKKSLTITSDSHCLQLEELQSPAQAALCTALRKFNCCIPSQASERNPSKTAVTYRDKSNIGKVF